MFVFSRCGGLLGRLVVDRLGRFGHGIGVLGASAEQLAALDPSGHAVGISLSDEREVARQLAYSRALLLLPEGPGERPIEEGVLLQEAERAGIRRVLRLSLHGAGPGAGATVLRAHGKADAALAESGLSHSILRPHLFMQDLLLFAPSIRAGHPMRGPISAPRVGYIDVRDVADAIVTLLQRPVHEGDIFTITGPRTWSLDEVARSMAETIGAPVPYEAIHDADMPAHLESIGLSRARAEAVASMLVAYRHDEPASRSVSRLTGLPPRALEMFLLDQRSHFTAQPRTPEPIMGEAAVVQLDHALSW